MSTRFCLSLVAAALAILGVSACRHRSASVAEVKDAPSGPTAVRPSWLLSPEQIESTIRDTWGLSISNDEAQTYFGAVHTLMGGTSVVRRTTLLTKPHELFVLTLDSLSAWVAAKLMTKQAQVEAAAAGDQFAFRGFTIGGLNPSDKISDPAQCQACFEDDAKPWCDCADGIAIGGLTKANLTPETLAADAVAPASKQWRKRIMHNMQDVGDFLMCDVAPIDDQTQATVSGQTTSLVQYLLDDVFLPSWKAERAAGADAAKSESRAWAGVVHAILVGDACFMDLTTTQN